MVINTLIEQRNKLVVAEVEIQLIPGIPQIHFLGLPDKVIKESFFRIKAAMKSSGFRFPVSQQVIVNIRPNALKKSSVGLELAVALGILHLTEQKILSDDILNCIIYGELSLDGKVREPQDLKYFKSSNFKNQKSNNILTGVSAAYSYLELLNSDIVYQSNATDNNAKKRPDKGLKQYYSQEEAEVIFLMSASRKHVLLAGQAGAGKSFLAKNYISFYNHESDPADMWYPAISPHHSLTPGAFLGGGAQLLQGEIEKVDNGVLILDELLEFNSAIIESLREPMTGEVLRIARAGHVKEIKPEFQVVATTNFCPCGKWTPEIKYVSCRFSVRKCKGYLERVSGPLLDRFGLIFFSNTEQAKKREVSGYEILERILRYEKNKKARNQDEPIKLSGGEELFKTIYGSLSGRRQAALLDIAEIYAIESGRNKIELSDLKKSENWTIQGFLQLEKGIC